MKFSIAIFRAFASCLYSMDSTTTWDIFCFHLVNSTSKSIRRTKWLNTLFLLMLISSGGYYHQCLKSLEARHVLCLGSGHSKDCQSADHLELAECLGGRTTSLGLLLMCCLALWQTLTEPLPLISVIWKEVFLSSGVLGKGVASTAVSAVLYRICIALHLSPVKGILPDLAKLVLYMDMSFSFAYCASFGCFFYHIWFF